MSKTVVDVGNCSMDHASLRTMLEANFEVNLIQAHTAGDAIDLLKNNDVNLLLVNRKFDQDQADGIELIRRIKSEQAFANTACMLISNFDEYQQQAVDAGAARGFGKQRIGTSETKTTLATFLG